MRGYAVRDLKANCFFVGVLVERLPEQYSCSAGLHLWKLKACLNVPQGTAYALQNTCCHCRWRQTSNCLSARLVRRRRPRREKQNTPSDQGLSHFANPSAIYKQQLSQGSICWGRPSCISVYLTQHSCIYFWDVYVCICTVASCIRVYQSLGICKPMVATNRSRSCVMNVLPPRKLLKKLVKPDLINRVMQWNRKVSQANEFLTIIKNNFENTFLLKGGKRNPLRSFLPPDRTQVL